MFGWGILEHTEGFIKGLGRGGALRRWEQRYIFETGEAWPFFGFGNDRNDIIFVCSYACVHVPTLEVCFSAQVCTYA